MRNVGFSDIRIFVVDDNANHSAGIKQLLELQSGYAVIGMATNGEEAIQRLASLDVDIVLMDMNMPEMDGISVIERIASKNSTVKILALTGYDDPDLIFRAMKAGARGYILKTMVTSQLLSAIEEVIAGKVFLPPALATKFFEEFHVKGVITQGPAQADPTKTALLTYLTNREKEVLQLLTEGVTYKGVADKLVISETTVKTHVNNIFQKLQVNDRTQAVLYALKYGLVEPSSSNLQAVG